MIIPLLYVFYTFLWKFWRLSIWQKNAVVLNQAIAFEIVWPFSILTSSLLEYYMLPYNCTLLCLYIIYFFQAVLFSFSAPVRLQLQVHQWVMTVSVMKFCVQCSGMTSCSSCRCLRVHSTLSHSMPSRPCMPSHPNEMDDCQGRNQRIRGNIYVFELQKRQQQRVDNPSSYK